MASKVKKLAVPAPVELGKPQGRIRVPERAQRL